MDFFGDPWVFPILLGCFEWPQLAPGLWRLVLEFDKQVVCSFEGDSCFEHDKHLRPSLMWEWRLELGSHFELS